MVQGMESIVVTVSGYHGSERMTLIQLINHVGANYVGKMSRSTTHLICWKFQGRKYELAKKFGTIILNHQWLEDCFKEGKHIPEHPYTLQSGKEVGPLLKLPVLTERAGLLTEHNLLSKKPKMFECLNEVIDLDSDDIENDEWDVDQLLDENLFPRPGIRDIAPQTSKRKLVSETALEDRQPKANQRRPIREPQIPTIDRRQGTDVNCVRVGLAESSHRSRRLVRKNVERNINGLATVNVEQGSRTHANVGDLGTPSSLSNSLIDFRDDIEVNTNRRHEMTSPSYGRNKKDEVNPLDRADNHGESSLQNADASYFKGKDVHETSTDVDNSNGQINDIYHSTRLPTSVELSCVICWTEFSSTRGVLPCGHRFCFLCIQNWADHMASNRKESTCPLCKASFASITRVDGAASLDQKIYSQSIPDPSSTQDIFIVPEGGAGLVDTEIPRQSVCCTCQSPYPADLLIYCQMCQSTCVHSYCLDPPLFPWTCNSCRDRRLFYPH
uniref:RING-type E3 ubiquitin transferase BRCA1 n=1 Tax=Opuntia streptacantha TaxID=393608 RepID=A0A7C9AZA6_OPUST